MNIDVGMFEGLSRMSCVRCGMYVDVAEIDGHPCGAGFDDLPSCAHPDDQSHQETMRKNPFRIRANEIEKRTRRRKELQQKIAPMQEELRTLEAKSALDDTYAGYLPPGKLDELKHEANKRAGEQLKEKLHAAWHKYGPEHLMVARQRIGDDASFVDTYFKIRPCDKKRAEDAERDRLYEQCNAEVDKCGVTIGHINPSLKHKADGPYQVTAALEDPLTYFENPPPKPAARQKAKRQREDAESKLQRLEYMKAERARAVVARIKEAERSGIFISHEIEERARGRPRQLLGGPALGQRMSKAVLLEAAKSRAPEEVRDGIVSQRLKMADGTSGSIKLRLNTTRLEEATSHGTQQLKLKLSSLDGNRVQKHTDRTGRSAGDPKQKLNYLLKSAILDPLMANRDLFFQNVPIFLDDPRRYHSGQAYIDAIKPNPPMWLSKILANCEGKVGSDGQYADVGTFFAHLAYMSDNMRKQTSADPRQAYLLPFADKFDEHVRTLRDANKESIERLDAHIKAEANRPPVYVRYRPGHAAATAAAAASGPPQPPPARPSYSPADAQLFGPSYSP